MAANWRTTLSTLLNESRFELQTIIKFIFYDDSAEDQAKVTELVYYAVIIALTKFGKMATNEQPKEFEIPLLSLSLSLSLSARLFNCRR